MPTSEKWSGSTGTAITLYLFPGLLAGAGSGLGRRRGFTSTSNLLTHKSLPNGVFAPYTSIPTNLLFFDRSGQTKDIWYYEIPLPEGRKNYTKTKPMQFDDFADCLQWFRLKRRKETDHAWRVAAADVLKHDEDGRLISSNLDIKSPNSAKALEHHPPEELVADILGKEQHIVELMGEIKTELKGTK